MIHEQEAGTTPKRTIGWVGATALAMGGSNQSLFLLGALLLALPAIAHRYTLGGLGGDGGRDGIGTACGGAN